MSSSRRRFLQESALGALATALPSRAARGGATSRATAAEAAQPSTTISESDVGSLYPFIESQASRGEFPLSFLQSGFDDPTAWKRKGRGLVLDLLHYAPARCDPRPETVERVDRGDYVREKVYFNTTPDIRVPAYVLVPKAGRLPAPGIVALHDHGGFYFWGKEKLVEREDEHPVLADFKRESYARASVASDLARRGFVVLVIDMFYWGERRMVLPDDPSDWRQRPSTITRERIEAFNRRASENEQLVARTILAAGFTWPGVMLWDDIRSVDYLVGRPEVDSGRIGCVGLSVGGLRSAHLAALDERIKAAVVVCWMASFPAQLRQHVRNTIGFTKLIPGLYRQMDYPDVVSLAMPTPLLVIAGSKDGLFEPGGLRSSFRKLEACYAKAGVADHVRTRLYDTPHVFNAEMQAEAWTFLETHLLGSPSGPRAGSRSG
jgi:dienelactone hydrolase